MKEPIGIIGGLSPYSTILYYKFIVEYFRDKVGRDPRVIVYSIPLQEMCKHVSENDRRGAVGLLAEAIEGLDRAGARIAILAANTPHMFLREALERTTPGFAMVDIREAVAWKLDKLGVTRVGLLATGATVESRLYHDYLEPRGFTVITPNTHGQKLLDSIINTLVEGRMPDSLNLRLAQVVSPLIARGAEALIYGCTELSLLVGKVKFSLPIVDSLSEHVKLVVERALE